MSHAPAVRPPKSRPQPDQTAVEFRVLGTLEALKGGTPIALGGPKQRLVLAMLILEANRVVSADRLVDHTWGDGPPEAARSTLQAYISRLRQALTPTKIEARGPGYVLEVNPEQVDAFRFETLVENAKGLPPKERAAQLSKALSLWRGPAFADFPSHPLALGRAAQLNELRMHALEGRIDADLALGRHGELTGELESLVSQHPLRERLCGQLMLALYRSGRQGEASAVYQKTRLRLVEELGMEPGSELRSLLTRILKQDSGLELVLDTAKQGRTNLPVELTSFVGREAELDEIVALARRSRLVSLIGPGGVGKTRLALETVRLIRDCQPGIYSAFFVDLAPLQAPELLEQTVITALGAQQESSPPSVDAIAALLGPGQALLLIDNCEHLIESVARFVDQLLRRQPNVSVLATSREPLRIGPEVRWLVSALSDDDAMRLFVDRARLIDTRFLLTEETRPTVLALCRGLDHLPLAIELAAARVGQMPVGEILARLDDRFALLTESGRTAPIRHRSLEVALDWSYQLLEGKERDVFARLSVFAGGFDAKAAQAVAGCTLDELGRLAEKSMVVSIEPNVDGRARYRLLETLRQYAFQRLGENEQALETGMRHFTYFADLAAKAAPELRGPNEFQWLQRLDEDLANLRSALEWAVDKDPDAGLAMAVDLEWLWQWHDATEGRWWLRRLLSKARAPRPQTVAAATRLSGDLAHMIGERGAAEAEIRQALDLWRRIDDAGGISRTLVNLAQVLGGFAEQMADQRGLLEEALVQARRAGDDLLIMEAISFLGMALTYSGNPDTGRACQHEAEALARRIGHTTSVAVIIWRDAAAYLWQGDLDRAYARCEDGLAVQRSSGNPLVQSFPLVVMGSISLTRNDLVAARRHFEAALAPTWISLPDARAIQGIAVIAARNGSYIRALKLAGAASTMEVVGWRRRLPEQELHEWIDIARRSLDQQTGDAAWRAGVAMSGRQAIVYALSEEDESLTEAANRRPQLMR